MNDSTSKHFLRINKARCNFIFLLVLLITSCTKDFPINDFDPESREKIVEKDNFEIDHDFLSTLRCDTLYTNLVKKMSYEYNRISIDSLKHYNMVGDSISYKRLSDLNAPQRVENYRVKSFLRNKYGCDINNYLLHEYGLERAILLSEQTKTRIDIGDVTINNPIFRGSLEVCNVSVRAYNYVSESFHPRCRCSARQFHESRVYDHIQSFMENTMGDTDGICGIIYVALRQSTSDFGYSLTEIPFSGRLFGNRNPEMVLNLMIGDILMFTQAGYFDPNHMCDRSCFQCLEGGGDYIHGEEYIGDGTEGSNPGGGGNDGNEGGDGGEEDGGGEPVSPENPKSNKELMDKTKFVKFNETNDCLTVAKEILKNYGLSNYGSSAAVIQVMKLDANDIIKYNYENYQSLINCIDRHINNNRPIIVGICVAQYTPTENHDRVTNHFVVVTGRGYDSEFQMYYYTYMETGTSKLDKGCNTDENRLYYDPDRDLYDTLNYNKEQMQVTHVRPNDGNTTGTTSQF